MNQRSYLDYNATAPLRDEVRDAVIAALSLYGNPSAWTDEGLPYSESAAMTASRTSSLSGAVAL